MAAGREPRDAAVEAIATAGRSVLVAGATVVISLLGLFLMGLPYLYGVALAAMLAVLVVMAARRDAAARAARLRRAGGRPAAHPGDRPCSGRPRRDARGPLEPRRAAPPVARRGRRRRRPARARPARHGPAARVPRRRQRPRRHDDPRRPTTSSPAGFGPGRERPAARRRRAARRGRPRRGGPHWRRPSATSPGSRPCRPCSVNAAGDAAVLTVTPATAPQDAATEDLVHDLRDGPVGRERAARRHVGGVTAATVDQSETTATGCRCSSAAVVGLSFLLLLGAFRAPLVAIKAGAHEPAVDRRGLRRRRAARRGRLGRAARRASTPRPPVPPFIPVMMFADPLRPVDGLRGVPAVAHPRGALRSTATRRARWPRGWRRPRGSSRRRRSSWSRCSGRSPSSPEVFLKLIGLRHGDGDPRRRDDRADGARARP